MRFTTDVDGFVSGVRFYKGSGNTGTHVGSLWSATGERLTTATFENETESGWQEVRFSRPVRREEYRDVFRLAVGPDAVVRPALRVAGALGRLRRRR